MTVDGSGEDLRNEKSCAQANAEMADAEMAEGEMLSERSESDAPHDETSRRDPREAATLTPQIRDRIAVQLRAMYDSVASQPVPDRFADLIAKLDATERDAS